MCYTCGCGMPHEDHGDPRNITEKHFHEAAKTKAAGDSGLEGVKENTADLIDKEIDDDEADNPKDQY